jgi:hypothetical protein
MAVSVVDPRSERSHQLAGAGPFLPPETRLCAGAPAPFGVGLAFGGLERGKAGRLPTVVQAASKATAGGWQPLSHLRARPCPRAPPGHGRGTAMAKAASHGLAVHGVPA